MAVHRSSDPGPLDRDVPVDRRGAGADDRRGGARPRRARRLAVAPGPADRRPGAAPRPAGRPGSPTPGRRRRPGSATPTGGCRSSRSRGTNGKRTVTRLITHILKRRRPARRDDDVRRRPRRRADGRAGRLDRSGRRRQILERSDIDVAVLETARGGIVLRGMGYESNDASVITNVIVGPPRPPGHPHAARAGRGEVDGRPRDHEPDGWAVLNADDPLRRGHRPARAGARRVVLARAGRRPAAVRRHRRGGGRAYVLRDGWLDRAPRARAGRAPIVEVARVPDHARRAGPPQRRERARGGRRRARRWAPRSTQLRDGLRDFRPSSERSPGRLNIFRLGSRVVIVDFAHNEAGVSRGPRRGRGDRRRRRGPGGAGDRDHRHGRRSAGRHAPRASGGSPASAPSGSRSRRRCSTCAAGAASRSSARSWPASRSAGRPAADVPVYESETEALRAELAGRRRARAPGRPGSSS